MLSLFPEEKIISEADNKTVVLTTHRICYEYKDWTKAYNQSIMLEHITSCENQYKANMIFLVIGIIFMCAPFILVAISHGNMGGGEIGIFFLIGIVFLLLYWFTRKSVIIVASPSTKMKINTTGMKRDNVLHFINLIEQTKHQRVSQLDPKQNFST